ncbi:ABC transporter permease [Rhodanobacter sp. BL-MT-08]
MFGYYLDLAWHSLRRSPVLTALMVLAIGLGIGASMTMMTVLHVMSSDPLPALSSTLYYPHLDPLPKDYPTTSEWGDASDNMTWPDAMALLHARKAERQAAMAGGSLLAWPVRQGDLPFSADGRYTTADFFSMFGVPMERGSAWSSVDDEAKARVVVLSHTLAAKLFGNEDALGHSVRLGAVSYRVVGISSDWAPQPMFYADPSAKGGFGKIDQFFLPLDTAADLKLDSSNDFTGWKSGGSTGSNVDGEYKDSSTSWLQVWVQLKNADQVRDYEQFLYNYSAQQHASGRFERAPDQAHLYPMMDWLAHLNLVPSDVKLQSWLALGFLVVCMTNIVALLLAKFLKRSGEVSVRRAMGARRRDIFLQFGIESLMIGSLGGVLGIVIAELGLWSIRQRPDAYAKVAQMNLSMLLLTVLIAIIASVLAGMLPAWRASRVAPALQLKTQ